VSLKKRGFQKASAAATTFASVTPTFARVSRSR
jgi:hypothetical protein